MSDPDRTKLPMDDPAFTGTIGKTYLESEAAWPDVPKPPAGAPNGMAADSCQPPSELVDRYAAATGRDLSRFAWYEAFSAWKLAIVLEGSYATHLRGESRNPLHELFGPLVDQLLIRAGRFAQ